MPDGEQTGWVTEEQEEMKVGINFIDLVKKSVGITSDAISILSIGTHRYQVSLKGAGRDCVVFLADDENAKKGIAKICGYRSGLEGGLQGSLKRLDEALQALRARE